IRALEDSLSQLPEVAEISYTSADEALRLFRERHSNDYPTIQALDEINENPLGAYLNVRAKEIYSKMQKQMDDIRKADIPREKKQELLKNLHN
ncbi:MAG: hypothetical protein IID03_09335, partial [Candidatus Dadabacteria bacterium]|nr:hypothetical protein [Candidatus Dadabacteria bacterium]